MEGLPWMWSISRDAVLPNTYVEFRRDLEVSTAIQSAWIALAADTSYRLWVNDRLVFHGSLREVSPYFYYDVVDLTSHLVTGKNQLRILVHYQGVSCGYYAEGPPGLLVIGEIRSAGKVISLSSVDEWQARTARRYRSDSHRLGGCIGFSEHYDFSVGEPDWAKPVIIGNHPLQERPQALLRDLPVFVGERLSPKSVQPLGEGVLCDFGQEVFGFIDLDYTTNETADLHLCYAEALTDGVVQHRRPGMDYRDVLTAPSGRHAWRSYEKRAFRFLYFSRHVHVHSLQVTEAHYPYEHRYRAEADRRDPGINRILEVSARTIELCSDDLLNDCPWRERSQYFDCFFYMEAMQKLFGTLEPVKRFLRQYARGANAEGILRMSYPSPLNNTIIPDFSLSYAVQLEKYLELSGDRDTVGQYYPYALRAVREFRKFEDGDGLLTNVPGWVFLDNGFELLKQSRSAALNAVYSGAYRSLARITNCLGRKAEAAEYEAEFQRLRQAFRNVFWTGDRILDSDLSPEFEGYHYWNYHHSAETGKWEGKSFVLKTTFQAKEGSDGLLRFMFHGGGRVWVDGQLVVDEKQGGGWICSALFQPHEISVPADGNPHTLQVEIEFSGIDWEFYIASREAIIMAPCLVWETDSFAASPTPTDPPAHDAIKTVLRPYFIPRFSQVTTGYSVYHGLLEDDEARTLLRRCLPENYYSPYAKRTTPYFVKITDNLEFLQSRVTPCNVPASLFYFCHALRQQGMNDEAQKLLRSIYSGMLERGATTWWEEFERRSSLCHAWASFVAVFFLNAK